MKKFNYSFLISLLLVCTVVIGSGLYPDPASWSFKDLRLWSQPRLASGTALPPIASGGTGDIFILSTGTVFEVYRFNATWTALSSSQGVATHSLLSNLSFASSGHTGFASTTETASITSLLNAHISTYATEVSSLTDAINNITGIATHSELANLDFDSCGHTGFISLASYNAEISSLTDYINAHISSGTTAFAMLREEFIFALATNSITLSNTVSSLTKTLIFYGGIHQQENEFTLVNGNRIDSATDSFQIDDEVSVYIYSSGLTREDKTFAVATTSIVLSNTVSSLTNTLIFKDGVHQQENEFTLVTGNRIDSATDSFQIGDKVSVYSWSTDISREEKTFDVATQSIALSHSVASLTKTLFFKDGVHQMQKEFLFVNGNRIDSATDSFQIGDKVSIYSW